MGTQIDSSLKERAARVLPSPKTPRGNYQHSVIKASVSYLSNGALTPAELDVSVTPYEMLLFLSDNPINFQARSFYAAGYYGGVGIPSMDFEEVFIQTPTSASLADIFTATQADVPPEECAYGVTATAGVSCSGYMMNLLLTDRSITGEDPFPALDCTLLIRAQAQSGVLSGTSPVSSAFGGAGSAAQAQVILLESDYTQAMFDAGNRFTDSAGVVCQVVGIWGFEELV